MKLILGLAFGAAIIIIGAILAVPNLIGQTPNTPVVEDQPERRTPPPYRKPYMLQVDPTQFTRYEQVGGLLELAIDQGETRSIEIQIIPRAELTSPTLVEVGQSLDDAGLPAIDMVGVEVSFSPRELLLKPGETSIVTATFHANSNALDRLYRFSFQVTGEEFPGRSHGSFDVLIGDAGPRQRDNALVEEIEEISPVELQDFIDDGWEVVKQLEDGRFLVRRLAPAFAP